MKHIKNSYNSMKRRQSISFRCTKYLLRKPNVKNLYKDIWLASKHMKRCPVSFSSVQFSSVTQSHPTLCDPMNWSTPGLPVHHQHPEFTQTHAHRVSGAIQPSHPLSSPSLPAPNPSQHQGLFQWVNTASSGQSTGVSALASFHPENNQDRSPLGWTSWISLQSKGLKSKSQEPSPTPQFKSSNSSALEFLHSPTLTSIHDHWKNHTLH